MNHWLELVISTKSSLDDVYRFDDKEKALLLAKIAACIKEEFDIKGVRIRDRDSKDSCLDEVYLGRLDCIDGRLVTA